MRHWPNLTVQRWPWRGLRVAHDDWGRGWHAVSVNIGPLLCITNWQR